MVGNVSEWVNDTYNSFGNYSIFDELMPTIEEKRKVARGSGFSDSIQKRLRVTDRQAFDVDYISAELGFRCSK
jgi:formylglycine-generating enzyme required for sulfatase activity